MAEPDALLAGRYRLVRQIGRGGMGVVWEARDERLERPVAVKQLRPQVGLSEQEAELAKDRAMREARISARLHHRNAVPVFDVVEHEGLPCLIMQFLPSVPLSAVLREVGPLAVHEAAQVGAQVASALAAAHQLGIVHRDVKPGNILIADDGTALISDFGISHAMGDATLTSTGLVHGTPAYLAPEVARGEDSGFPSDVFSLGATLYAALEGSPPFGTDHNSIALLHRVAAADFPPPQRAGALTPVLLAMLQADPAARPSMREVAARLAAVEAAGQAAGGSDEHASTTAVLPTASAPRGGPGPVATAGQARVGGADVSPTVAVTRSPSTTAGVASGAGTAASLASTDGAGSASGGAGGAGAVPTGPASAEGASGERATRRRRAGPVLVAVALLVGAGLLAAALFSSFGGGRDGVTADPLTTPTATAAPSSTGASSSSSASATASPSPRSSASASPSPSPTRSSRTPTPKPSPTKSRQSGTPTDAELAEAIRTYYSLIPDNTDRAWPRLTPRFQSGRAGGRDGFEGFWDDVRRVRVTDVEGDSPSTAVATITYYYKDGRVLTERTSYQLVRQDGILKIDASTTVG